MKNYSVKDENEAKRVKRNGEKRMNENKTMIKKGG